MGFRLSKKTRAVIAGVLIVLIAVPASFAALPPKTAHAQLGVPTGDILNTIAHYITSAATYMQQIATYSLNPIAYAIAQAALQMITQNVITWIKGGFNGNPAFITDPGSFFLNIGNQVAGNIIYNNSDLNFLCDPIAMGLDIRAALALKFFSGNRFQPTGGCTLTQVVGDIANARLFVNGQITTTVNGQTQTLPAARGWDSWLAITQNQDNNIYGAYTKAEAQVNARVEGSQALNKMVADWGQGFKSLTLGLVGGGSGDVCTQDEWTADYVTCSYKQDVQDKIVTPGDVLSSQINKSLSNGEDALQQAHTIGELVSAALGQILDATLQEGLAQVGGGAATGGFSFSTSPLTPFLPGNTNTYSSPSNVYSTYNSNSATAQGGYNTTYNNTSAQQQGAINAFTAQPQNAKLSLTNAYTSQTPCTQSPQQGTTFYASNAIDGSNSTVSSNFCDNQNWPSYSSVGYWEITLPAPAYLDEVRYQTYSSIMSLYSWQDSAGAWQNPRLVLFDPSNQANRIDLVSGAASGIIEIPAADRITPTSKVRILAGYYANNGLIHDVELTEVQIYQHLLPTVDASNFPSTIASTTAFAGFSPLGPAATPWVSATYYPMYNNPQPAPLSSVHVVVKDQSGAIVYPSSTSPLTYTLTPNSYTFQFSSTMEGFTGPTTTRNLIILP